jgi:Fe-Mn family superoxide dismutase|tara:strand:+ start:186 stop:890 length:705 start_codon:yes stop_codon:yes gene_type:complete
MKIDNLFTKEAKKAIKETLNVGEKKSINESFAAQPKKFNLKTDFLSPSNAQNHIELYEKYVKDFNSVSAQLDAVDKSEANSNHSPYRSLKIDETYNMNAAYLHELWFSNIADANSRISMDSLAYMRLNRDFGTFDDWQRDFIACAMSARCGWAITYLNTYTQSYMNCVIDLHSQNVPVGMQPVIVMDLWQHAYYRDYLKDINSYMNAMMKQLRWPVIESRFEKADKILNIIRGV